MISGPVVRLPNGGVRSVTNYYTVSGVSMELDGERDRDAAVAQVVPISFLETRRPYRIVAERLGDDMAAQVIEAYGEVVIQIDQAIPSRLRRSVAKHAIETHGHGECLARDCLAARAWLEPLRAVTVNATA